MASNVALSWEEATLNAPEAFIGTTMDVLLKFNNSDDRIPDEFGDRCLVCQECNLGQFHFKDNKFVCSRKCLFNAWSSVVEYVKQSGKNICGLPGCTNLCSSQGTKQYDHCTVTHYLKHKSLCGMVYGTTDALVHKCDYPGCHNLCPQFGHLGGYCCKKHKQKTWFCERCPQEKGVILFYDSSSPYYEFSNFYEFAPFKLDKRIWNSSEQYFQAQKFIGTPYELYIQQLKTSRQAFEYSRKINSWKRGDWEEVKEQVMYLALLAKFSAHERLRMLLFSTGQRTIVEHTFNDSYWGDGGGHGNGKNKLGQLLMQVRDLLQKKKTKK